MESQWRLRPQIKLPKKIRDTDFPKVLLTILAYRGYNSEDEIINYLNPKLSNLSDPFLLSGMDKVINRLIKAIDRKEKIILYGDYDVDGVTSTTICVKVLKHLGADVNVFLPQRSDEGYGVSLEGLNNAFEKYGKPDLLFALDCGTSSIKEFDWLFEQNIDSLILDHHEPHINGLPKCIGMVNPKAIGSENNEDFTYFCTAGLAFKLVHALLKKMNLREFDLKTILDFVAVGTISDIVPLIRENRILVYFGLKQLEKTENIGLQELKKICSLNNNLKASDVGFRIGPRINAAGRLGSAKKAFKLFFVDDLNEAKKASLFLENQNKNRQKVELKIVNEVEKIINKNFDIKKDLSIIYGSRDWHQGVIGIVASKIMRKFNRPCFIISFDKNGIGKGSGRSIEGISLIKAINNCKEHLINGGGHNLAAGITVEESKLNAFQKAFNQSIIEQTSSKPQPTITIIDAEIKLSEINIPFIDKYDKLRPFGNSNTTPIFVCRNIYPATCPKFINNKHMKIQLEQGNSYKDAIYFNIPSKKLPEPPWDVIAVLERNNYRGSNSVQLYIKDLRSASEIPYQTS